jgi:hypothetical protein
MMMMMMMMMMPINAFEGRSAPRTNKATHTRYMSEYESDQAPVFSRRRPVALTRKHLTYTCKG